MEGKRLGDIRDSLAMLPGLEEQMEKLQKRIYEAEDGVNRQKYQYETKSMEVDKLEQDSFYTVLLRLFGQYYRKLDCATEEALTAKMKYDRDCEKLEELYSERARLSEKIGELRREERLYEEEVRRREELLMHGGANEIATEYRQLEEQRKKFVEELKEIDKVITAANRAKYTIHRAMDYLNSAHSWATYDVWTKGGIFSHIAKYDHVDNAQKEFNKLNYQLRALQRELSDVNMARSAEFLGIDATTRAVDYWFDNIFTDLNVRSTIRENQEKLRRLERNIDNIILKLAKCKAQINRDINKIEYEREDLIISDESW